jgi:hypothetical protein
LVCESHPNQDSLLARIHTENAVSPLPLFRFIVSEAKKDVVSTMSGGLSGKAPIHYAAENGVRSPVAFDQLSMRHHVTYCGSLVDSDHP